MRRVFALGCAAVALATAGAAHAARAEERRFDIAAGDARQAIPEFARQAGVQIAAPTGKGGGLRTRAVRGTMDTRAALRALIAGTGLEIASDDGGMIVLRKVGDARAGGDRQRLGEPAANDERGPAGAERVVAADEVAESDIIIVTAQKYEQPLNKVPISMTVLGGEELDSFTQEGVQEALELTPGITINGAVIQGSKQVAIRGVAAGDSVFAGSGPVAFYVDGVPFGFVKNAAVPDMSPYDLDRVEVLRGPQGTLYGASALNGVIRILTHDPDLLNAEVKARAGFATTKEGSETYRADMAVNLPLIPDKLAVRMVAGYNDVGGWIDRPSLPEKDSNDHLGKNFRIKLKAQPTEQLGVVLSAWLSREKSGTPDLGDENEEYPVATQDQESLSNQSFDLFGGTIRYDAPGFSVTGVTSYIDFKSGNTFDYSPLIPAFGIVLTAPSSKVFAQEVTLHSTGEGPWRWTLGGFYRDAEDRLVQAGPILGAPAPGYDYPIDFTDKSKSFAFFGELTRTFFDGALELTGGVRYFEDEVTQIENSPTLPASNSDALTRPLFRREAKFTHVSPRAVLTWFPSDTATLYASYGQGFRSGSNQWGTILGVAPNIGPVKEDRLNNYELGAKGKLFGGWLGYDLSLYYIDWQDVQQQISVGFDGVFPCGTDACLLAFVNGISASGMGFDAALKVRVTDRLTLSPTFSWNDLKWDQDVPGYFVKGTRAPYSVEYTVGGSASWRIPLGVPGLDGELTVGGTYNPAPDVIPLGSAEDKLMINAGFTLKADRWSMRIYADNLTDERATMGGFSGGGVLEAFSIRQRPRTVGVQVELKY